MKPTKLILRLGSTDSTYTEQDSSLARGEYSPEYYTETAQREAAKRLYEKTGNDANLAGIFEDFRDSIEIKTNIPAYRTIEKEGTLSIESNNLSRNIDSLHQQIQIVDSLLISSNNPQDSLLYVQQKIALQTEINSLLQDSATENEVNFANYHTKIETTKLIIQH